jgi:hypothetical protein
MQKPSSKPPIDNNFISKVIQACVDEQPLTQGRIMYKLESIGLKPLLNLG